MPDVGLFTATEPLSPEMKVVIKYAVEVNGLPVYQESYSVETLAQELEQDEARAVQLWARRIKCVVRVPQAQRIFRLRDALLGRRKMRRLRTRK